jgi:hypothetical protein
MVDEKLQNPIWDIDTIRQLVDKTKKLADEIKTLEAKEAFYKEIIINYAKENWLKKIFWDLYKVSFSTRDSYSIDEESEDKIIEILKSHWLYDQLLKLDSTKFTKFIKEWKINFDEIEDSVNHKESFYISRISAKKDGEEE